MPAALPAVLAVAVRANGASGPDEELVAALRDEIRWLRGRLDTTDRMVHALLAGGPPIAQPSPAILSDDSAGLYLDLLKRCLTRLIFGQVSRVTNPVTKDEAPGDPAIRADGYDWPADAETMIGLRRLNHLQHCVTDVVRRAVPGDLIETGVWRGGAAILMRAVLKAYRVTDRTVWVADSFRGLPPPDPERYPADADDPHHLWPYLAVPVEEVRENFARYGLLDDQVRFLEGWFRDTLPRAPIEQLAVLRIDGDMYESTMDALCALYPRLSPGGYLILDDYGTIAGSRKATDDYRTEHGITEPMGWVDITAVWWQKRP